MRSTALLMLVALSIMGMVSSIQLQASTPKTYAPKPATGGWAFLNLTVTMMFGCSTVNENTAYFNCEDGQADRAVLVTKDGGNTFQQLANNGSALFPMDIIMSSEDAGVLSGVSLGAGASAYYSSPSETFLPASEPGIYIEQTTDLQQIGQTNGSGFATVGTYNSLTGVSISLDVGKTWAPYNISSLTLGAAPGFGSFPSPNVFIVSSTVEQAPSNGNSSSSLAKVSRVIKSNGQYVIEAQSGIIGDSLQTERVSVLPANVTGYWGEIDISLDGGKTWKQVFSTDKYSFGAISCPTVQTCFVIAFDATGSNYIMQSTNQGVSWDIIFTTPFAMSVIHAYSETELYAVGGAVEQGMPVGYSVYTSDLKNFQPASLPGILFLNGQILPGGQAGFATGITIEQVMQAVKYTPPVNAVEM